MRRRKVAQVEVAVVVAAEEEEGEVAAEGRPAPDATPWWSLPQIGLHPREGQAAFHEKFGTP